MNTMVNHVNSMEQGVVGIKRISLRLVSYQHVHFFYLRSHLRAPQNGHAIISNKFLKVFIFEYPSKQFTLWILYWAIFMKIYSTVVVKTCARFVSLVFGCFSKNYILHFYI